MGQHLLTVKHLQVSVGDPADKPPGAFGYWVAAGHARYHTWPFSTAAQRQAFEDAVVRYLQLDGVVLPVEEVPPFAVSALIALSLEGEAEDDLATRHLERWGITGRPLDDLRTIATTFIAGLPL